MIYLICGLLGAVFGSFAGAQVWRLRARQLVADVRAGDKVDRRELAKVRLLTKQQLAGDRSRCLHCQQVLAWYDLLPVVSWLLLRGRCRYCRHWIGWSELLLEVCLAGLFMASVMLWPGDLTNPVQISLLLMWLVALVLLSILFVYDVRWMLLPDVINWPFIGLAAVFALVKLSQAPDLMAAAVSLVAAIGLLSGLYGMLYWFSRWRFGSGRTWVGFGDVKLTLGLALFLGSWPLAFVALFAANLLGTLWVLPSLLRGKLARNARIAFGPLLISGFVLAWLFGGQLIAWYDDLFYQAYAIM